MTLEESLWLFDYDKESGLLYWSKNSRSDFVGREAGYKKPKGRIYITFLKKGFYRSHIVWLIETGELPKPGVILDHKDRDPSNDRYSNLRPATRSDNWVNTRMWAIPRSGHRCIGVSPSGKFRVVVRKKGAKKFPEKTFDSLEDAIAYRDRVWDELHGEFIGEMST